MTHTKFTYLFLEQAPQLAPTGSANYCMSDSYPGGSGIKLIDSYHDLLFLNARKNDQQSGYLRDNS